MLRLLSLPPEEAIAFFRRKGFRIGFDHRDVWQAEHQAAFTVAKAMQLVSITSASRSMPPSSWAPPSRPSAKPSSPTWSSAAGGGAP